MTIKAYLSCMFFVFLTGCGSGGSDGGSTDFVAPVDIQRPPADTLASSTIHVWALTGHMANSTISGTITTDAALSSYEQDAHNLAPNQLYHLIDWDLTISQGVLEGAPIVFTPQTSTDEWCLGQCLFDPRLFNRLLFTDGVHTLQLAFTVSGTERPTTADEWGVFEPNASELLTPDYIIVARDLSIDQDLSEAR